MMLKNMIVLLSIVVSIFCIMPSFAFGPGAGQAQMQNNMQEMQKNKQQIQKMRQNQEMIQKRKTQQQQMQQIPQN